MPRISRRAFVQLFGAGVGSAFVASGVTACTGAGRASFEHGVASGDPLTDRVIVWTRVTPRRDDDEIVVAWQVATDPDFTDVVVQGEGPTNAQRDFTIKVDATGLSAGSTYHYRFMVGEDVVSPVGTTKTLPQGAVDQVKLLVVSCSNYPAGWFHVYAEAATVQGVDAVVHLGDYIYEHAPGEIASADAEALGRVVDPPHELVELSDYRRRYAQYHTDPDLQALHAAVPWITVWDDHEVANNAWREGAENHQPADDGDFELRLMAGLQAYAEWLPIRPPVDEDISGLQRAFKFGDLVNLIMLDTRLVGRDQQIDFGEYVDGANRVVRNAFFEAIEDPERTLLGEDQRDWLLAQLEDEATWQVLGQQVLMGIMVLPSAVLPRDLSDPGSAPLSFEDYVLLATVGLIQQRINADDKTVTKKERAFAEKHRDFFVENVGWLLEPNVPYNLDAWDGYGAERETVLQKAVDQGANLVVLAGDTHNAWANNLELTDGTPAGVELATPSVSSPGLEEFLGLVDAEDPRATAVSFEGNLPLLVERLKYSNLLERGFMTVTFTAEDVTSEWTYIDDVKAGSYSIVEERGTTITVPAGVNAIE